ncbi:hypothetical protein ABZ897_23875 [Nonomuraea sp. NPDC046802]
MEAILFQDNRVFVVNGDSHRGWDDQKKRTIALRGKTDGLPQSGAR